MTQRVKNSQSTFENPSLDPQHSGRAGCCTDVEISASLWAGKLGITIEPASNKVDSEDST